MTNQRIRLTKTLLSNAFIDLLQEKNIAKITIQELADKAGVNRSTFYLHYSDVYDLLNEIEERLITDVKMYLDEKNESQSYIEHLLNYIYQNKDIFRTVFVYCDASKFNATFLDLSRDLLMNDFLVNQDDSNVDYVIEYLIRGNNALILKWIHDDFNLSVKELSDLMVELSQSTLNG